MRLVERIEWMRAAKIWDFCPKKLDKSIRGILADEGIHPKGARFPHLLEPPPPHFSFARCVVPAKPPQIGALSRSIFSWQWRPAVGRLPTARI
jgi:hypothetical protein